MAPNDAPNADRVDRNTWIALTAMALGVFVIANDFTALSVAIPEIEHDLSTSLTKAQWVINGYALVFGVLLVTGGRLADLFGRKRVFMVGAAIFAGFSLVAGLVPGAGLLIAARMAMGIGGALMWPAILGMTYALLPESKSSSISGSATLSAVKSLAMTNTASAIAPSASSVPRSRPAIRAARYRPIRPP